MWHFMIGSAVCVLELSEVAGENFDGVGGGVGGGVEVVGVGGKRFLIELD